MTRRRVTDEQYNRFRRRADELVRRVDEGTLPFDKVMDALQATIEGRFNDTLTTPTFLRDKRKEGWRLVWNLNEEPVPVSELEPVSFLKQGEEYISGQEMRVRAYKEKANFGQRQAEYMLEHEGEMPFECRDCLAFPGTGWCDQSGSLLIPCLLWYGDGWCLDFAKLEREWDSFDRIIRRK
ncbi:MAG: hypothetical protein HYY99_01180 [Candidatus Colwellbacteria bacterium]|nr:hypothetical protein [Candidatus Colwellbacteria bacterium]